MKAQSNYPADYFSHWTTKNKVIYILRTTTQIALAVNTSLPFPLYMVIFGQSGIYYIYISNIWSSLIRQKYLKIPTLIREKRKKN
jgi:hypothetical protein